MAYLRQYQYRGDPFLGGIGRFVGGLAKGAIKAATGISIGGARKSVDDVVRAVPGVGVAASKVLKRIPKGVKIGAGAAAGGAILGGMAGRAGMFGGGGRTYRRMNPGNVKALRRSMRRVTSFAKLARSVMTFTKTHRIKKGRKR